MADYNDNLTLAFSLWGMGDDEPTPSLSTSAAVGIGARRRARKAAKADRKAAFGHHGVATEAQTEGMALDDLPAEPGGFLVVLIPSDGSRPSATWVPKRRHALAESLRLGRDRPGGDVKVVPFDAAMLDAIWAAQANAATGLI